MKTTGDIHLCSPVVFT